MLKDDTVRVSVLLGAALVLAVSAVILAWAANPEPAAAAGSDIYLPICMRSFAGPFPDPPTVAPATQEPDTATPTEAVGPTEPPSPTPLPSPTPSPTPLGPPIAHAEDDTIILQIGRTSTGGPGAVWEEMNGTPWFTLYGDGRVIAGRKMNDVTKPLFEGHVDEETIQGWLGELVYGVGFLELQEDYVHGFEAKPEVHIYLDTEADKHRVSLRGFPYFERRGAPDYPEDEASLKRLTSFVRTLEASLQAELGDVVAQPFEPECFTVLAQDNRHSPILPDPPKWEHSLSIMPIARAAPTAASNYVDRVVGHKFVDGELGASVQAYIVPIAEYWFPLENRAAEFVVGARHHTAGARKEVPGGSLFLPNNVNDGRGWFWYRRDAGSGSCPSLPYRQRGRGLDMAPIPARSETPSLVLSETLPWLADTRPVEALLQQLGSQVPGDPRPLRPALRP